MDAHFSFVMLCTRCNTEKTARSFHIPDTVAPVCILCDRIELETPVQEVPWDLVEFLRLNSAKHCQVCDSNKLTEFFSCGDRVFHGCCNSCAARRAPWDNFSHTLRNLVDGFNKGRKRNFAGLPWLTEADVRAIYFRQNGCCMFFKTKQVSLGESEPWRLSIIAIDPSQPISFDNIGIACREFQTSMSNPWTQQKLQLLRDNIGKSCDVSALDVMSDERTRATVTTRCSNHIKFPCGECTTIRKREYRSYGAGYLRHKLSNMKHRDKEKRGLVCTLTYEDLRQIVLRQKGLCAVSHVPMVFKTQTTDFQASVERVDPRLGYTVDNTTLICSEFNVLCNNYKDESGPGVGAQWTRQKFLEFQKGMGWEQEEKEPSM